MFDVGIQEILIILVIALLVVGPKKLPELARNIGKGLREFRRASTEVRQSLDLGLDDIDDEPATRPGPTRPDTTSVGGPPADGMTDGPGSERPA